MGDKMRHRESVVKSSVRWSPRITRMTAFPRTASSLQILRDGRELFHRRFQIGGDVGGDDFRRGQVGALFQRVIFQPEDVEVHLVTLRQLVVGEGLEPLRLDAVVPRRSTLWMSER
jgi:hypothetical protein